MNTEFHTGGAESITARIFSVLSANGHQVEWCALYRPGPTGKLLAASGQSVSSEFMRHRGDWRGFLKTVSWLKRQRPDIVWFIAQPATVLWSQLAARLAGAATVAAVHNTIDYAALSWWHPYRWLLRGLDRVVCVADRQREALVDAAKLRQSQAIRIYNGIDFVAPPGPTERVQIRQALGIGKEDIVVVMVARLYPIKGADVFIRAARLCLDQAPALRFVVIGGGPEADALKTLVDQLGLGEHLSLLGHRNDVQTLLACFDIGVLSSRSEALPMGLLEYMAAGLPVVATRVGSVEELVQPGVTGALVAPEAPRELADAIIKLAQDRDARINWGEAGRQRALLHFSLVASIRQTEALCLDLRRSAAGL